MPNLMTIARSVLFLDYGFSVKTPVNSLTSINMVHALAVSFECLLSAMLVCFIQSMSISASTSKPTKPHYPLRSSVNDIARLCMLHAAFLYVHFVFGMEVELVESEMFVNARNAILAVWALTVLSLLCERISASYRMLFPIVNMIANIIQSLVSECGMTEDTTAKRKTIVLDNDPAVPAGRTAIHEIKSRKVSKSYGRRRTTGARRRYGVK